jgi:hypothetical protein
VVAPAGGFGRSTTEKPPLPSRINAGTGEPVRVSPPEAVAYPVE